MRLGGGTGGTGGTDLCEGVDCDGGNECTTDECGPIVTPIAEMEAQTVAATVTGCRDGEGELGIPRYLQSGRVAQLDRALPSGAAEKSTISCKNQGILISVGSQKSEQKRAETHDNWNCASYENLDRARRAWGALRVI